MAGRSTLNLVHVPDHAERMVAKLPTRLQAGSPRLVATVYGMGLAVQEMEDLLFATLDLSTLDNASGEQLDRWGDMVGEERGPLGDASYRRFIRARMKINRWHDAGVRPPIDDLISIWRTIMGSDLTFYVLLPPATFELVAVRPFLLPAPEAERVVRAMQDVVPAGVAMVLSEATPSMLGVDRSTLPTAYAGGGLIARRLSP